jgi:hypothetical protein
MYSYSYIPIDNLAYVFIILRISINIIAITSLLLVKPMLQSLPDILYFKSLEIALKSHLYFFLLFQRCRKFIVVSAVQYIACVNKDSPVSTTTHRCHQRLTSFNNDSLVSTTTHRCQQRFTGANSDSPVSTTTHQCQQRLTGVSNHSPVSTTTHRCQQKLTGVNNDSPVSTTTHRCQQ